MKNANELRKIATEYSKRADVAEEQVQRLLDEASMLAEWGMLEMITSEELLPLALEYLKQMGYTVYDSIQKNIEGKIISWEKKEID